MKHILYITTIIFTNIFCFVVQAEEKSRNILDIITYKINPKEAPIDLEPKIQCPSGYVAIGSGFTNASLDFPIHNMFPHNVATVEEPELGDLKAPDPAFPADEFVAKIGGFGGYFIVLRTAQETENIFVTCVRREAITGRYYNARSYGVKGDGSLETLEIKQFLDRVPDTATAYFPSGTYRVNDTILIDNPISIVGDGMSTQILQESTNKSLFLFSGEETKKCINNLSGFKIADMYLGSKADAADTAILDFIFGNRISVENMKLSGGKYAIRLRGSLEMKFTNLSDNGGVGNLFFPESEPPVKLAISEYFVHAAPLKEDMECLTGSESEDDLETRSPNNIVFFSPTIGTSGSSKNGIYLTDGKGSGALHIYGGTIQSQIGVGVHLHKASLPSSISGVHFEGNGRDIFIDNSGNTRVSSIFSDGIVDVGKSSWNTLLESSNIGKFVVDNEASRTTALASSWADSQIGSPSGSHPDVVYIASGGQNNASGRATIGIGVPNPNYHMRGNVGVYIDVKNKSRSCEVVKLCE